MKILHLFPDTNLFVQCRALEELDWSVWAAFDEVYLIVCRPVQREIDNQKGKGDDRIGRRARQAHSLFREIILSEHGFKVIRKTRPPVRLVVEPSNLPNPALADHLDYTKVDDEIVGCVHAHREQNPESDTRLLTHDSGPMASARMLSVPFVPIPDNWLLQPESNEEERENKRLKNELERLKKAEPQFAISCLDDEGNETNSLEFEYSIYEPLTDNEISTYLDSLKEQFPLTTDFGPRESREREPQVLAARILGIKEVFKPASDEKITAYTETNYPAWVERCEHMLRQLHVSLEKEANPLVFSFSAENEGTRPGKDALITITAKGNFQIRPPQIEDDGEDDGEQDDSGKILSLPLPPKPPKGKWTTKSSILNQHNLTDLLSGMGAVARPLALSPPPLPELLSRGRDTNQFYYKPNRSEAPAESFSLECEQWRHGIDAEIFEGELCVDGNAQEIHGALECRIHAENLSTPAEKTIPVRGRIRPVSARTFAEKLIDNLLSSSGK